MHEPENLTLARRYLRALETEADPESLRDFFTADVVQREYPHRLTLLRCLGTTLERFRRFQRAQARRRAG